MEGDSNTTPTGRRGGFSLTLGKDSGTPRYRFFPIPVKNPSLLIFFGWKVERDRRKNPCTPKAWVGRKYYTWQTTRDQSAAWSSVCFGMVWFTIYHNETIFVFRHWLMLKNDNKKSSMSPSPNPFRFSFSFSPFLIIRFVVRQQQFFSKLNDDPTLRKASLVDICKNATKRVVEVLFILSLWENYWDIRGVCSYSVLLIPFLLPEKWSDMSAGGSWWQLLCDLQRILWCSVPIVHSQQSQARTYFFYLISFQPLRGTPSDCPPSPPPRSILKMRWAPLIQQAGKIPILAHSKYSKYFVKPMIDSSIFVYAAHLYMIGMKRRESIGNLWQLLPLAQDLGN